MPRLLLVDDDEEVLKINAKYFAKAGYEVKTLTNAQTILKVAQDFEPDCIVMDVMMPGVNGYTACKRVKEVRDIPIIFLTGRDSEDDKIHGLMLGADDYVVKPYSLRELEARIQVMIRRYAKSTSAIGGASGGQLLEYPPLSLNLSTHKAYYESQEISLSNKEYELLLLLASSPDRVFTFEEIGNAVWGGYITSDKKTIMVTINRLRKKLSDYPVIADWLENVWSKGYQFVVK